MLHQRLSSDRGWLSRWKSSLPWHLNEAVVPQQRHVLVKWLPRLVNNTRDINTCQGNINNVAKTLLLIVGDDELSYFHIWYLLYYRQHVRGSRRCQAQLIINVPSRHRCHLSVVPLSRPVPSSLGTMTMLPPLYLNEKYIFLNYFFCSLIIQSLPT